MESSTGRRLAGLDHLRFLAAFSVFIWHLVDDVLPKAQANMVPSNLFLSFFEEGHHGVSLFICITGFILTYLSYGKTIRYGGFLKNRFLRLFPLVFLMQLFAVATSNARPDSLLLLGNLLGGGYVWGMWTLVIEAQFYLFFPFLMASIQGKKMSGVVLSYLGLIVAAYFFRLGFFAYKGNFQIVASDTIFGRIDQFLMGSLAALAFLRLENAMDAARLRKALAASIALGLGVLLLYDAYNRSGGDFHRLGGFPSTDPLLLFWPTIEGAAWSAVILCWCLAAKALPCRLSNALAYGGAISYSMYMLHIPVLFAVRSFLLDHAFYAMGTPKFQIYALLIGAFPVTLGLSAVMYESFEKPFLRRRVHYLDAAPNGVVGPVSPGGERNPVATT